MPEHKPVTDEELDEVQRYYHVDSLEARVATNLRGLQEAAGPFAALFGSAGATLPDEMEMVVRDQETGAFFGCWKWADLRRLAACLPRRASDE